MSKKIKNTTQDEKYYLCHLISKTKTKNHNDIQLLKMINNRHNHVKHVLFSFCVYPLAQIEKQKVYIVLRLTK